MTDESRPHRRLSNALIFIGVAAWLPYFFLLAQGANPPLLPFLAFHLGGVVPGAWLRLRGLSPAEQIRGQRRKRAARVLVILGVLAWAPYFYLTRLAELDVSIGPFLAAHLTGVLGGSALRISVEVERLLGNRGEPSDQM